MFHGSCQFVSVIIIINHTSVCFITFISFYKKKNSTSFNCICAGVFWLDSQLKIFVWLWQMVLLMLWLWHSKVQWRGVFWRMDTSWWIRWFFTYCCFRWCSLCSFNKGKVWIGYWPCVIDLTRWVQVRNPTITTKRYCQVSNSLLINCSGQYAVWLNCSCHSELRNRNSERLNVFDL